MMTLLNKIALFCAITLATNAVQAAITLDRTRVIYDGQNKSISLNISNENKQLPYLAQAWIEDTQQQKITSPLVVTPPVQRVEPGARSMVRIAAAPEIAKLPQDRESLFYFNLREIPPRSDKPNVMQIALQTKVKLFYRPQAIASKVGEVWQEKIVLHKTAQGYRVENPTPYYVTVIGITAKAGDKVSNEFDPVMVAPKSSAELKSGSFAAPVLTFINDYGGRPELTFSCSGDRCQFAKTV